MRIVTLQSVSRFARVQPPSTTITTRFYGATTSRFAKSLVSQRKHALRSLSTSSSRLSTKPTMAPAKIDLKTAKGTRDWDGEGIILRDQIFETIKKVFKGHGAVTIDTPVFELKEILTGKYGEDSKLIYDLADQGGELCSLRYDLTVPFARYVAQNGIQSIRRYHIAKVYRRDQPAVAKGRMREFYQCDFDIAGTFDAMAPDAEVIATIVEVFKALGWNGNFTIKMNHRKILDGIFQVCGVPEEKIRSISSAVDKLDKMPWAEVKKEMVEEKGLPEAVADRIGDWVVLKGGEELLERLQNDELLSANESMKQGMADMALLFKYLKRWKATSAVSFDLSLARGLDYYTGIIYEVITEGSAASAPAADGAGPAKSKAKKKGKASEDDDRSDDPSVGVGSVAAGGRYDNLVGMFSGKGQIPCVGISFGVDRIYSIMKARIDANSTKELRGNDTDVYVMAFGGKGFTGMYEERLDIFQMLREADINTEMLHKVKPKLQAQFKAAEANKVPFAVILGEEELAAGQVRLKQMGLGDNHPEKEGVLVAITDLAGEIRRRLDQIERLEQLTVNASGLRVVDGMRGEDLKVGENLQVDEAQAPAAEES